jgi:AmiR/NasT family two-component response regulator
MSRSLRIAVADDEPDVLQYLRTTLPLLGHQVVVAARTGDELLARCRVAHPDLVITDIRMPNLDGIAAGAELFRERPTPVILVSAYHDPELVGRAGSECVFGYLVKPIKEADLPPAIAVAMSRFEQFRALRQDAADLRQALEDRKLVERAKGVLMRRSGADEADAYRRLQKLATDRRCKLAEAAQWVLTVDDATRPPDGPAGTGITR